MTQPTSRRCQQRWTVVLLSLLALVLTLMPIKSEAQISGANPMEKSPVVVDGKVLFAVGDFGNATRKVRENARQL